MKTRLIVLIVSSFLFGGCYLSTELCEPEEVSSVVQYLGRTCPEPIHNLIPREPYREVRSSWEGPTLIGCDPLETEPEDLASVWGFRLEVRETFPDRACFEGYDFDDKCEIDFDRYFEIVFVDEVTGRDACSERWGILYDSRLE